MAQSRGQTDQTEQVLHNAASCVGRSCDAAGTEGTIPLMGIAGANAADMLDALSAATPGDATLSALASRVRGGEKLLFKDDGPEHITASYLVFDSALGHVLLQFHTKGQFWVQFGGHLERADSSFLAAAVRELVEESGLVAVALVSPQPLDVDVQSLDDRFGMCRTHFDLLFAGRTARSARAEMNQESEAIEWFAVDRLPPNAATGLQTRVLAARLSIRQRESES